MRHAIWEKDDFFLIGGERIDMDPVVVECKEEPIPIVWQFDFSKPDGILGRISDIRIENEELIGDVRWLTHNMDDERMEAFRCRLGGYYMNVVKSPDGKQVLSCILRGVGVMFLDNTPGYPKAKS